MAGIPWKALAPALGAAAVVTLASGAAHTFEREWHLGAGLGGGMFTGESSGGPAVAAYAGYGLSDMFDLRAQLLASRHDFGSPQPTWVYSASAGVAYKLDIIRWVPWVDALVGYYRFQGGALPGGRKPDELGLSVGLGIDYAVSRSFAIGAELRYHGFVRDLPTSLSDTPYFTGLLRAEYTWGW